VIFCNIMWYYVVLCNITLNYVILCSIILFYVMLCYIMLYYVCMLCYFYLIQCYVGLYYVMLYCIVLYCIVLYYIVLYVCMYVCTLCLWGLIVPTSHQLQRDMFSWKSARGIFSAASEKQQPIEPIFCRSDLPNLVVVKHPSFNLLMKPPKFCS